MRLWKPLYIEKNNLLISKGFPVWPSKSVVTDLMSRLWLFNIKNKLFLLIVHIGHWNKSDSYLMFYIIFIYLRKYRNTALYVLHSLLFEVYILCLLIIVGFVMFTMSMNLIIRVACVWNFMQTLVVGTNESLLKPPISLYANCSNITFLELFHLIMMIDISA